MPGPTRVSSAPLVSLSGRSDAPSASVSLRVRAVLWCIARGADERPSVPKCLSERVCGHARGSDRGSFGVAVGDEKRRRHVRLCGCGPQPSLPTTIERLSYDDAQPLQLGGSELSPRPRPPVTTRPTPPRVLSSPSMASPPLASPPLASPPLVRVPTRPRPSSGSSRCSWRSSSASSVSTTSTWGTRPEASSSWS